MAKLTLRGIEALKPKEAGYKVTADRGLYLRVAPDGSKVWLVRYVINGKQIQARLPRPHGYDGEGYMTLAQAVSENARIQALARDAIDFQEQQAEAEQARVAAKAAALAADKPLRDLFETWLTDGVSRKDGNAELRRTFEKDVLPTIGDKKVRELCDADLLHVLRAVGRTRGAGRAAERMLTEMRQMFRWAIKRQPWRSLLVENGIRLNWWTSSKLSRKGTSRVFVSAFSLRPRFASCGTPSTQWKPRTRLRSTEELRIDRCKPRRNSQCGFASERDAGSANW